MDTPQPNTVRTATYLAAQQRTDLRGALATRTGKTRGVKCNPPNVRCGGRCIPPTWDCRLQGKGTNSELAAHKTDPLAGIASLQRGAKDLAQGVVKVDPARVQRGRSSLIRGVVKLTPGNNLEQKKQLKRRLTEYSTPISAVLGIGLVGLAAHAGLKRGFGSYRNGIGADIDRAAARAVDSVLDRVPGIAGPRAARRAAGASATGAIATAVTRGARLETTRAATSGNLGRIGPLSFRPNAADYESSYVRAGLDALQRRARSGASSFETWQQAAVQTLYGARSPGGRTGGQRGSIFSEHAANEFLVSKFGLNPQGAVSNRGAFSTRARNTLVDTQLSQRLGAWGSAMRDDMRLRRIVGPDGAIRTEDINRYIREVGNTTLTSGMPGMSRAQRNQALTEAHRLMRTAISGSNLEREARSIRTGLVAEFDTYFSNVATSMRRNAAASDSPFGDGLTGLARYITRANGQTTQIVDRGHADLILRNHFHTRVMRLNTNFTIGDNTARRIAQSLSRSTDLPDVDTAYRILNENGFPQLSRGAARTGRRDAAAPEDGTIRTATYLAARADAAGAQRLGKPCGASHIAKALKCSKTAASTASDNRGRTAAALAAGAALTTAGLLAYRSRSTLVPGLSQSAIRQLSAAQVKAGLDKLPEQFREPARQLVGDAKRAAAHMALRAQGAQIKAVDVDHNFSTWVTATGTHLSVGSVGDSLLTFGAERKANIGKFPQFGLGFTIDTNYDAAGGMPSSQAKQLIRTTKAMYKAQLDMLPEDAFLFAVPHKADGKGTKRKSIYEGMGFRPIPGLKGDKLWALKNQGKFSEIPDNQVDMIRSMIRGDEADKTAPIPLFAAAIT